MDKIFIGIDVGTGSARAGLFDAAGTLLASAKRPIRIWREEGDVVEQSSDDIWAAVCASVVEAMATAGVAPEAVSGIGFDATCSLVALDADGGPVTVSPSGDDARNIVVWMDHRAMAQTERINATGHRVLQYVGGRISPEMETPKLLWLKETMPEAFARAAHFFDLADFLSWRATGSLARSVCTVTCKWTYLAHEHGWDRDYFETIGLGELAADGFARIGSEIVDIATPLGSGLTERAADELGLRPGTSVGASLIDAHAGGVGTLGAEPETAATASPRALALIMGTSLCAMAVTREPTFVPGVWGPYFSALEPGYWLLEGGQSAYGAALDTLVATHPAAGEALDRAAQQGLGLLDFLEQQAVALAGSVEQAATLAAAIHVVPEYLGNRAPEADPAATAVIAGLTLDGSLDALVRLFVAGLCGLCYGTRQIVDAVRAEGVALETIVVSGGAARSPLLRRILADVTGLDVSLPKTDEPVLLGAAMLGAVASGHFADLPAASAAMTHTRSTIRPLGGEIANFHAAKFEVYTLLQKTERTARALMAARRPDPA